MIMEYIVAKVVMWPPSRFFVVYYFLHTTDIDVAIFFCGSNLSKPAIAELFTVLLIFQKIHILCSFACVVDRGEKTYGPLLSSSTRTFTFVRTSS